MVKAWPPALFLTLKNKVIHSCGRTTVINPSQRAVIEGFFSAAKSTSVLNHSWSCTMRAPCLTSLNRTPPAVTGKTESKAVGKSHTTSEMRNALAYFSIKFMILYCNELFSLLSRPFTWICLSSFTPRYSHFQTPLSNTRPASGL